MKEINKTQHDLSIDIENDCMVIRSRYDKRRMCFDDEFILINGVFDDRSAVVSVEDVKQVLYRLAFCDDEI